MRKIALLLVALSAAFAQEDPRARARQLELDAEKALDEGRRADALKLLAEAAEIRAQARDAAPKPVPDAKATEPMAGAPPAKPEADAPPEKAAAQGLAEMDAALGKGDTAAALKAGVRAREALGAWAKDLEARERRLAEREKPVDWEKRMAEIEAQLAELQKRIPSR